MKCQLLSLAVRPISACYTTILQFMSVSNVAGHSSLLRALVPILPVVLRRCWVDHYGCESQSNPNFVHRSLPIKVGLFPKMPLAGRSYSVSWITLLSENREGQFAGP